ncbi:MAG TPA: GAF domain-containing protein, partial [Roseiarcus sp.]
MSLTRKASSQAKKPTKPPRDDLAAALVERESELAQARRERTATSEILQVIASSPDDLQPVLDKIAETACRLCKAYDALVLLREGDQLRPAAHYGPIPVTFASQAISPCLLAGRAVIERRAIHIDDIAKHAEEYPVAAALASGGAAAGGMLWRANLVAPLMREGEAVGAIGLRRAEPAPFSEDQIELLKTFSHQAVIAIENTRLFRETQEALEQQKASADVLSVIGKSVSDAAPVFEAILEACQRLFGSDEIGVYAIGDDGMVRVAAWRGPRADEVRRDVTPLADSVTGRIIRERRTHHIPDLRAEPNLSAFVRERVERLGSASLLYAPMLWEERGLGSILVARSPPRPFSDREQALLQSFADQAAIAIENARLSRETQESLRQQTATSDILRVIASSPGDLQPVLDRLAETTCRLCEANDALLFLREGGDLRLAAHHGPIPTPAGFVDRQISRDWVAGRSVADREPIHVHDLAAASDEYPLGLSLAKEAAGAATPGLAWRTTLSMPLIREGEAVGAITLRRVEVWPFTDAQITLLRTFADQAVIAIENARLFDEVQARTRDLTEALQQQTATTNVLKVISRSAFDLDAVLKTLTDSARSLSGAATAAVFLRDGEFFPLRAESGVPHEFLEYMNGHPARPGKATLIGRVAMTGEAVLIPDALADPDYSYGAGPQIGNYRALFGAPMIRDGRVEGVFGLMHPKPSAFMPRQMEMVRAFADQAVIAIENARLFDEVQARTRDVEEALEQQKASAEILSVISNSVADAQPVFEKILHSVEHIFGAEERIVFLAGEDGLLHIGAMRGPNSERARALYPMPLETTTTGLAISERRLISFADVLNGPDVPEGTREVARRIGQNHALVVAPMLFEGRGIGSIVVARFSMRPFNEKECALLRTFADQAVIAIQNARLFNETREALEQQTAAGEILRVISSSPTDVQPVFDAIAHSAAGLCEATNGTVFRLRDGLIHLVGHYSLSQEQLASVQRSFPAPLDRGTAAGRAILGRAVVHIHDIAADAEYSARSLVKTGLRSVLSVPMLRNGESIGSINVSREEARPFSARQIELLKTFADQAVIAVNNVGLFNETQEALERQTATADILKVIASSPTDVQPVFHAIATSAKALIGGASASVQRYVGDTIHLAAFTSTNPAADEALMASFPRPLAESAHFVLVRSGETAQFADTESEDVPPVTRALARLRHFRSMLFTPLMSNGAPIGIITVTRKEPGTFAAHHVQLLKTFADQAVIAVNNVGLFNETQEALRQQTATADVLKAISRTAFDLDTVLGTLISTAAQLSGAKHGQIFRRHGDVYRYAGSRMEVDEAYLRHQQSAEIRPGRGTLLGRVALEKRTVQIVDAWNDPEYAEKDQVRQGNLRAMLGVPLMRDGEPIGAFALARNEPVPFTQRQIELVTTFADQAVIAIENARLFDEVQAKTRDLEEALEHQTATSEVLSAISRSPTEVQPVFDAIARSATELCGATSGGVDRFDGELIHLAAHYNWTPEALAAMRQIYPATPGRGFASARAILTRSVVHIPDISLDPEYTAAAVVGVGFRSVLAVPMLRDGEPIGAIALVRLEPRPFTARQIALLQTFAEQAVIAINNVRLFDEVEARTREVEEALAQQTATADVLKVISRSAFDLQTVLDTLAASAAGLIGANFVAMYLRRGDVIRADATFGASPEMIRYMSEHPQRPGRETAAGRVFQTGEVQNIPDVLADPDYEYGVGPRLANFRALLGVPMVRDGKVEGSFTLGRSQPGLFTRRQIELVQTFADQAVIAIENVRLFDEVQARTHDLEESLQQQTATANVLKVISRSAFDLDAVLKTLTDSARSLSSAVSAVVMLRDGDVLRLRAESGCDPQFLAYMAAHPTRASKETLTGRVFLSGEAVSIPDALADPDYNYGDAPQLNNYRALLGAPLIRDGKVEGVFGLMHPKPGGFTPRQMELVRTFADQAVIAIENARLLDEVQARTRDIEEALQQQTATADVLKVISRSTFDLQPVLDTLVESAARLCDTEMAFVLRRDGEVFRAGAAVGYAPEYMEYLQNHPLGINRGSVTGRVALEGRIVQIADVTTDPEYTLTQTTSLTGQRTALGVPLIRDGEVIGVIVLARRRVELFTDRQIELVTTFADQAVIAISNVGLFNETQ